MPDFSISFLDHVAIHVKDMEISAKWYEEVLGLKKYQLEKWGDFPIFMLAGKTGVAIFPAKLDDPILDPNSNHVKIDHFAFQVTQEDYAKAKKHYQDLGISFHEKDHHYFHSIYTFDPDGHTVELTTLMMDENDFYHLS